MLFPIVILTLNLLLVSGFHLSTRMARRSYINMKASPSYGFNSRSSRTKVGRDIKNHAQSIEDITSPTTKKSTGFNQGYSKKKSDKKALTQADLTGQLVIESSDPENVVVNQIMKKLDSKKTNNQSNNGNIQTMSSLKSVLEQTSQLDSIPVNNYITKEPISTIADTVVNSIESMANSSPSSPLDFLQMEEDTSIPIKSNIDKITELVSTSTTTTAVITNENKNTVALTSAPVEATVATTTNAPETISPSIVETVPTATATATVVEAVVASSTTTETITTPLPVKEIINTPVISMEAVADIAPTTEVVTSSITEVAAPTTEVVTSSITEFVAPTTEVLTSSITETVADIAPTTEVVTSSITEAVADIAPTTEVVTSSIMEVVAPMTEVSTSTVTTETEVIVSVSEVVTTSVIEAAAPVINEVVVAPAGVTHVVNDIISEHTIQESPVTETTRASTTVSHESISTESTIATNTNTNTIPVTTTPSSSLTDTNTSSFLFLDNLNCEQLVKKTALSEMVSNEKTLQNIQQFKTILSKSLNRKQQAEQMIIDELITLRPLLRNELNVFETRAKELQRMIEILNNAYDIKAKQIKQEEDIITQMKEISYRISEKRILSEYNFALEKKGHLLNIDKDLYHMINTYLNQVQIEFNFIQEKVTLLTMKSNTFPAEDDRLGMLQYSWDDIAEIQSIFSTEETMQNWKDCDNKVKVLIDSITEAEKKRAQILQEENTYLPTTEDEIKEIIIDTTATTSAVVADNVVEAVVTDKATTTTSTTSDSNVHTAATVSSTFEERTPTTAATSTTTTTTTVVEEESFPKPTSLQRLDPRIYKFISVKNGKSLINLPVQVRQSLIENRKPDELAVIYSSVLATAVGSIFNLASSVVEEAVIFTGTKEGEITKKSVDTTVQSMSEFTQNMNKAIHSVKQTWSKSFEESGVESSADELLAKVAKASKQVLSDKELQSALNAAGKNVKKSAEEVSVAAKIATETVGDKLKKSKKFKNSWDTFVNSAKFMVQSVTSALNK